MIAMCTATIGSVGSREEGSDRFKPVIKGRTPVTAAIVELGNQFIGKHGRVPRPIELWNIIAANAEECPEEIEVFSREHHTLFELKTNGRFKEVHWTEYLARFKRRLHVSCPPKSI